MRRPFLFDRRLQGKTVRLLSWETTQKSLPEASLVSTWTTYDCRGASKTPILVVGPGHLISRPLDSQPRRLRAEWCAHVSGLRRSQ
jgi:hypothetical protein